MSWLEYHTRSEEYTIQAEELEKQQDLKRATEFYRLAARELVNALEDLDLSKKCTLGITVVSAASSYYRAGEFAKARQIAHRWLATALLPAFAVEELGEVLEVIGDEESRIKSELQSLEDVRL
ncbi:MAG: hypothetical protein AB4290_19920 [Spirulina sp.]